MGRLIPGAFGDVTVIRPHGAGDVWSQVLNATERDIVLVVVDGQARYGDERVMKEASAGPAATLTVAGRRRRLALANPADQTKAWKWRDVLARLEAVRQDPAGAVRRAEGRRRAFAGPITAPDAPLELALDMPSGGRFARAGRPPDPRLVVIPKLPTLVHDRTFFADVRRQGFHHGLLDKLEDFYG
jgi:hypothetical protein